MERIEELAAKGWTVKLLVDQQGPDGPRFRTWLSWAQDDGGYVQESEVHNTLEFALRWFKDTAQSWERKHA